MFADVVIPDSKLNALTYSVNSSMIPLLHPGSLVLVNLRNEKRQGIVVRVRQRSKTEYTKPVLELLNSDFYSPDLLSLTEWVARYYFSSWSQALSMAIPKGVYMYKPRKSIEAPFKNTEPSPFHKLTKKQIQALNQILAWSEEKEFRPFLIVGKKRIPIYLKLIDQVLKNNQSAIILVPEISLTPSFVSTFASRFPESLIILHSRLTQRKRKNFWQRIRKGEFRIVLGPRSVVFAPVKNLGLIVVDDEHDLSYKEIERIPHYHARDVAIMRGKIEHSMVVLGSTTPSTETFYNTTTGKYGYFALDHESHPVVQVIDMKQEGTSIFSTALEKAISEHVRSGNKILLFINRRGFSSFLLCTECGFIPECPECGIPLVYHKTDYTLRCHFCKYREKAFELCPQCKGREFRYSGVGTEKVERALKALDRKNAVLRLDSDTSRRQQRIDNLYEQFTSGEAQILVGTRTVTKGSPISGVKLIGAIMVDTLLHFPDFRSGEKTFQMLIHLGERMEENGRKGQYIIQTYHPEHHAIQSIKEHNYQMFFQKELVVRKELSYPPYSRLGLIRTYSKDRVKAEKASTEIGKILAGQRQLSLLGPTLPLRPKRRGMHEYILLVKMKGTAKLHSILSSESLKFPQVKVDVDIDPVEMG